MTGSMLLTSAFHGLSDHPRGFFSEGHLDSLGLCLFLAVRRMHADISPELRLLILDDVMHSVDGQHRRRTAKLILKEFSDHQMFITTHDPLWFEVLKREIGSTGKQFAFNRISRWSLGDGPEWGDHRSAYDWLRSKEGSAALPTARAAKAGLLLEQMLQNLCNNLKAAVLFNITGNYTIQPLWAGFLTRTGKNKEFRSQLGTVLSEVESLRSQRDWSGSHWNSWAQQLTAQEVDDFVEAITALRKAVFCTQCNQFITEIPFLKPRQWSCARSCLKYVDAVPK